MPPRLILQRPDAVRKGQGEAQKKRYHTQDTYFENMELKISLSGSKVFPKKIVPLREERPGGEDWNATQVVDTSLGRRGRETNGERDYDTNGEC